VELLGQPIDDWQVTPVDSGIWRNAGARLWAARTHLEKKKVFCANYSEGLPHAPLHEVEACSRASRKIACVPAEQPNLSCHQVEFDESEQVTQLGAAWQTKSWISGGSLLFRREIFECMNDNEELVVEPFRRLIAEGQFPAYPHQGLWDAMDTLRDKPQPEDKFGRGDMPWLPWLAETGRP
jgi:glucose-1-phosphate cytidylyltransferase